MLEQKIYILREHLNALIEYQPLDSTEILKASQALDKVILQYTKKMRKTSKNRASAS